MKNFEKDYIKAAKRAAREVFGFEPEKISVNRKKYSRAQEKRNFRMELEYA